MSLKTRRHATILRIVRREAVESQAQLRALLAAEGLRVTQATLSRDLREIGLTKIADPDGNGRYVSSPGAIRASLADVAHALLVSVDGTGALLVLRTTSGGAAAIAAALDRAGWPEVLGAVASADTALVITKSEQARRAVQVRLNALTDAG